MLKLLGLVVGLVAVAATRSEPPPIAGGAPASSVEIAGAPPVYATRDVLNALNAARP